MANRKPNPMKGIPRSEWARVKAERAANGQTATVTIETAPGPASGSGGASFDPHIVRESLQPPDKKADAVFPQQRCSAGTIPVF